MAGEAIALGVIPVGDLTFKIGTKGRISVEEDMALIMDMEDFTPSIDGQIQEWNPMDTHGWTRRLMTGKSFALAMSGKRNYGDKGNDYIASASFKNGQDCNSIGEIGFPNGDKLKFNCVINISKPFGGASTDANGLEFELQSDGKPEYILATPST